MSSGERLDLLHSSRIEADPPHHDVGAERLGAAPLVIPPQELAGGQAIAGYGRQLDEPPFGGEVLLAGLNPLGRALRDCVRRPIGACLWARAQPLDVASSGLEVSRGGFLEDRLV